MSSFVMNRTWSDKEHATLGTMYAADDVGIRQIAYTLEDIHNVPKIPGKTRIPAGTYNLKRRTYGRWAQRFIDMGYPGSIEIYTVENFTDVLVHYGNKDEHTEGCILLGLGAHMSYGPDEKPYLFSSKDACRVFYDIFYSKPDSYSWILYINDFEHRTPFA